MWIMEPHATNPLTSQRIVEDVNAALTSKGLTLVTADADLGVAAHAATQEERTLETFYDGFGGGEVERRFRIRNNDGEHLHRWLASGRHLRRPDEGSGLERYIVEDAVG
jgi:hypothetical protein